MSEAPVTAASSPTPAGPAVPILEVEAVHKHFDGIRAVSGAGFSLPEASITALIGPNGAGKTTLFNIVTGFYPADAGAIRYQGRSIYGKRPDAIARAGLVRTFQITKALAAMPVIDNMMLAAQRQPGENLLRLIARPAANRQSEAEVEERAMDLLATFGLEEMRDEYAGTLSGGQRKLLELARALMAQPRMVLLDEPMAGINPTLGRRLLDHMQELRQRDGVTFLFIEHDMEVVMNHSDEVVVMANGETVVEGPPAEIRTDQRVIDAYLGETGGGDEPGPEARFERPPESGADPQEGPQ